MARPTSLTGELSEQLCELHREGLPLSRSADAVGITYTTLKRWMKRTDEPYATFCANLKRARGDFQRPLLSDIRAGVDNWQSRAWLLERSDPANWGRKDRLEQTVSKAPADVRAELAKKTPEERIAMHKAAIAEEEAKLKGDKDAAMH